MTQKLRHILYWATVVVVFVPVMILAGAAILAEWVRGVINRYERWAYQERYVKL